MKEEIKLGLERIARAVNILGLDLGCSPSVLVAGTNGKGTTCAFIANILKAHGKKTLLYTSPHLKNPEERIQINGVHIETNILKSCLEHADRTNAKFRLNLTPFEKFTLAFFMILHDTKPDFTVCEVGLGGRLDATNVLPNEISVIASVGYDHMEFLGPTLEDIAYEKAGIIKEKNLVVLGKVPEEAKRVIENVASQKRARLALLSKDMKLKIKRTSNGLIINYAYNGLKVEGLEMNTIFSHFCENAALAITACSHWISIDESALKTALQRIPLEARGEVIKTGKCTVVIDTAHNSLALARMLKDVMEHFQAKPTVFLSLLKDKDWKRMLKCASALAKEVFLIEQDTERGLKKKDLPHGRWVDIERMRDIIEQQNGIFVIAGSFWIAKQARDILTQ